MSKTTRAAESSAEVTRVKLVTGFVLLFASLVSVTATAPSALGQSGPRVVLIVMENQAYPHIIGSTDAPYVNALATQGELFTNYSAVTSSSEPNYLAMTSGSTSVQTPPQHNVFQAVDASGGSDTWVSLEESMGGNCGQPSAANVPGTAIALYKRGHDPAYQFRGNESCTTHDVPLTATSFAPATLASFSVIVPNACDNMHTAPLSGQACPAFFGPNAGPDAVRMGDNWLSVVVPQLLAQPDVTVVLTWDEGVVKNEHVVALEVGAGVTPASSNSASYNHYSLEAGLYASLGLGPAPLNGASAAALPVP